MALSTLHPSRTFWFEKQCFTVINPSRVDFLPGLRIGEPEQSLTARDLRKAIWAVDKGPEMAYMLRSSHSDSSLLARLSCDPRKPPIVSKNKRFALSEDVLTTWKDLEQNLYAVSETLLLRISKIPEAKFPFDAFWPLPTDCGYRNDYSTFLSARRAILRSRDAFFLLASRCTLAIALFQYRFPGEDPPAWTSVLMDVGIPAPWIDELRAGPIADLSSGLRVGAFIDPLPGPACTVWIRHAPCMIEANLPTYISWPAPGGKLDPSLCEQVLSLHPCLRPYFPGSADEAPIVPTSEDPRDPQPCFRWTDIPSGMPPASCPAPIETAATTPIPSSDELRRLPHGPGQRAGEPYQQFFDRREAQWRQWEQTETAEKKEKRLARAAKAATYACPTRPTNTYLWMEVGDVDSTVPWYLLDRDYRKKVRFGGVRDMWEMYPNSHKRYDPWRDEWDICPKLSNDPVVEEDYFDDDDFPYAPAAPHPQQLPSQESLLAPASLATIARSFEADLQRFYAGEDFLGHVFVAEGFREVAFYRYGVVIGVLPATEQGERPPLEYAAFDCNKVQKYFGVLSMDLTSADLAALSGFLGIALKRSTDSAISAAVWDLDPGCPQHLLKPGREHHTLRPTLWRLSGVDYYCIRYINEPECWYDVLVDATTAVELLRRQSIRSRASAISLMVQKGIGFHTVYSPTRRDSFFHQPSSFGDCLGWRPRGFKATRHDYGQYIAQAYEVLCQPRGRAAILHGGIIWRLALEILGSDAAERAVCGPSEDIYSFGQEFLPHRGVPLYDDSLTSGEIDILCGVYKLPSTHGSQSELLSWWPRPNVFDTSGLAFGYWTPWCENWFQRRLKRIRDGIDGPLSAKDWRSTITFWRGVFPLQTAVADKSAAFLPRVNTCIRL